MVLTGLREVLKERDRETQIQADSLDESTDLIGRRAVLDSLGLVTLVVNLEQILSQDHGIEITIADERAMSQERSPFRTVGALSDYISRLIDEQQQNASA
jgi:acyl carrier protein